MSIKGFIGLIASGVAVYFYKQQLDADYAEKQKQFEEERQYFLDELAKSEAKVNPNGSADHAPIAITGTVRFGGLTLNQLEVWLNIKNYSNHQVEIGDIRSRLWVGNMRSERVMPSNNGNLYIPAGKTVRIRLYARGDVAYPNGDHKNVKSNLCRIAGISRIKAGTTIKASLAPAQLDLQYLYYWAGGQEECVAFDVPCDFEYKFAGWTVGSYEGYNAGVENQQKKNPSYWEKYDEQPMDEK